MQRRFTIIQGGLSESPAGRPAPARGFEPTGRVSGWRVVLRRPNAIDEADAAAWRALAERQTPDPFAHPDYLLTAARHGSRGADIAFAFAYAETAERGVALGAVLPLVMPHPVWGGPSIRLWHPPLAPRPVQPLVEAGSAPAAFEAILRRLASERPRAALRLGRIAADGALRRAVSCSARLQVETHPEAAVPAARFVPVAVRTPEPEIESITAPEDIRDAVERFLLLDAERSQRALIADPAAAAILRVVTRLFAQRGETCVELGKRDGALVSGAIRLGRGEERVLWRGVNCGEVVPAAPPTVDLDIRLEGQAARDEGLARPRLVTH